MLLKKIYMLTIIVFGIITFYTIPTISFSNKKVLRTNLEINEISLPSTTVYLINEDNYLVQTKMILEDFSLEEKIKRIIDYLTINNTNNSHLQGIIPSNVKLKEITIDSNKVTLDFTKEFLEIDKTRDKMITGIVNSLLSLKEIEKVSFLVDGKEVEGLKQEYDKKLSMNPNYQYSDRQNLNKVIIYYLDSTSKEFIPVTSYLSDNKEKIEIIVEELRNNPSQLMSYIPYKLSLLNYKEEENVMLLNFNSYLINKNEEVTELILEEIAYSVFDNYDVNMVMFEVNGEKMKYFLRENN